MENYLASARARKTGFNSFDIQGTKADRWSPQSPRSMVAKPTCQEFALESMQNRNVHDLYAGQRGFVLIRLAMLVYCACCPFAAVPAGSFTAKIPEEALRTLTAAVESGQVQSIDVIYFPIRITGDRMTPERLKKEYLYQITTRHLDFTVPGSVLLTALKRTKVVSSTNPADVRFSRTGTDAFLIL